MTNVDKLKISESLKDKIRRLYKKRNAGFTIDSLSEKARVSTDLIKYLVKQKSKIESVEKEQLIRVIKLINDGLKANGIEERIEESDIFDESNQSQIVMITNTEVTNYSTEISLIPQEFQTVIADKIQIFCGRKFVFNAINQFIQDNQSGYFTILGDAGMGKSAIAAKYIVDHSGTICFFNIRAEGRNRPDVFLKLIRQQLVNRLNLQNAENDDFSTLLTTASGRLSDYEKLVIVIDALDEVDQDDNGNLLNLPMSLPDKVYIILTRRPYNSDDKRLTLSPNTKYAELDLREYQENSKDDVESYILEFLGLEKYQAGLENWINQQNGLSKPQLVKTIAAKSENNFMYLRYVLEAIADGFYQDEKLEELPKGLEGYYESHWRIMGMTKKPLPKDKIKIIYVMCALKSSVSREMIVKYSQEDNLTVQEVLKGWTQFLQEQKTYQPPRYRFYHESFRDFLQRQDIVEAAGVSLPQISASNFRTWFNEKSEEGKEQFLGEYPRLLLAGKRYTELCKLLANYYFIEAKINHPLFGVQALIEDYDLLQNETLLTEFSQAETISSLTNIQEVLQLSAHIINRDSQQLAAQLTGRLLHFHTPEINNLLQQIPTDQGLRCLTPSLTPPGSPLMAKP